MSIFLRLGVVALLGLLVTAGGLSWYQAHPAWRPEYVQGKALIDRVEAFKRSHRRLPETQQEFDPASDESGPVFYQRTSDSTYMVWFGLSLGESYTYDSAEQSWR